MTNISAELGPSHPGETEFLEQPRPTRNHDLVQRLVVVHAGKQARDILGYSQSLTEHERAELEQAVLEGNEVRNSLFTENERYIHRIVHDIRDLNVGGYNDRVSYQEMVQAGAEVMLNALENLPPEKLTTPMTDDDGEPLDPQIAAERMFSGCMKIALFHGIVNAMYNEHVIHIPLYARQYMNNVYRLQHEMIRDNQREVSFDEALHAITWNDLGDPKDNIRGYKLRHEKIILARLALDPYSVNDSINEDLNNEPGIGNVREPWSAETSEEKSDQVITGVDAQIDAANELQELKEIASIQKPVPITERELTILEQIELEGKTTREVADQLSGDESSISHQGVSYLHTSAKKKLQRAAAARARRQQLKQARAEAALLEAMQSPPAPETPHKLEEAGRTLSTPAQFKSHETEIKQRTQWEKTFLKLSRGFGFKPEEVGNLSAHLNGDEYCEPNDAVMDILGRIRIIAPFAQGSLSDVERVVLARFLGVPNKRPAKSISGLKLDQGRDAQFRYLVARSDKSVEELLHNALHTVADEAELFYSRT